MQQFQDGQSSLYSNIQQPRHSYLVHGVVGNLQKLDELCSAVDSVSGDKDPGSGVQDPRRQRVRRVAAEYDGVNCANPKIF